MSNIGSIVEFSGGTLNGIPDLSGNWWSRLGTNKAVDSGLQLPELSLNEAALSESSTEESSVNGDQDPRSPGEEDRGKEDSGPKEDLKDGDKTHGGIIIFLDEPSNHISVGVWCECRLGSWRGTSSSGLLRWLEGWKEIGSGVGRNVENGVDSEWEHGERVLRREEPDEGHSQVLNILIRCKSQSTTLSPAASS